MATEFLSQPYISDSKEQKVITKLIVKKKEEFISTQIIDSGWRILPESVKVVNTLDKQSLTLYTVYRGILMNKTERVCIRMSKELKEEIEKRANEENRTISGCIENILKRNIENISLGKK